MGNLVYANTFVYIHIYHRIKKICTVTSLLFPATCDMAVVSIHNFPLPLSITPLPSASIS